jgi:membrane protein implicated in regulation of membrane protease activity
MSEVFWSVIVVLCIVLEIHTNAFVSLFLGVGAALGLALAIAGVPFPIQALVWVAGSAAGVMLLRPLALKRFSHRAYEVDMTRPTHTTMTHLTGMVEIAVGSEQSPGRVKIQGETWKAVTDWPETIAVGTPIVVDRAYGTTLWVNPK